MATAGKTQGRIPALLQEAVQLHQSGRLDEAERRYDAVLKIDRDNADALNLKGVIAADRGRTTEALKLFNRAIAAAPSFPDVHFNKGNVLAALGKIEAALGAYAESVRLRPLFINARLNAATLLDKAGRTDEALAHLRALTKACPSEAVGHHALGVLLNKVAADPIDEATTTEISGAFSRALALAPRNADVLCGLANFDARRGNLQQAIEHLQLAIGLNPPWSDRERAEVYSNLGEHLRKLEQYTLAVNAQRQALALQPGNRDIRYNLATALYATRELAEAEQLLLAVIEDDKTFARAYINLGNIYRDTNRLEEAGAMFELALAFDPTLAVAYTNFGAISGDRGWFNTSLVFHDKALALNDFPGARFKRAVTLLVMGRFAEGWIDYDCRFLAPQERLRARSEPPPYWRGEDLSGKSIVIWSEQGLGDEILHAGLVAAATRHAARRAIHCSKRLIPIFTRSFPGIAVDDRDGTDVGREFDYQTPIGSLGRYLLDNFDKFPRQTGYLRAESQKTEQLRLKYMARAEGRKIVGISWRSKNDVLGPDKSAALLDFAAILKTPGVMFVNLQYGDCTSEIAAVQTELGVQILDDAEVDSTADMDAFFAQVAAMDLVITTSNTTAHVAGSLNQPVWILLPFAKGMLWYWFLDREDSPWYPSARLFRAPAFDAARGWLRVMAPCVANELARITRIAN